VLAHLMNSRMADLQETKPSLRRSILGRRGAIDPGTRTAFSRAIVRDIVETSVYRRSNTVMAYASFGSELQTDELIRHVLYQGKTLLLPGSITRKDRWTSTGYATRYETYRPECGGYASQGRIGACG
jgi:5-formyltetrahydrofolate cyclo-ligase